MSQKGFLLLSSNTKIDKSNDNQDLYIGKILQLAPYTESGYNTCPFAKAADCYSGCIFYSGMGKFKNVKESRVRKTKLFFEDKSRFMELLEKDLAKLVKIANKENKIATVRLNGFSDILWEQHLDFSKFKEIIFYDYTKYYNRVVPENYHLLYSFSPNLENHLEEYLKLNTTGNYTVVFNLRKNEQLPEFYKGRKVIDGDLNDFRFLDEKGIVVGLKNKIETNIGINIIEIK